MLGEKIGEEHGKITTRRVLPGDDYRYIKLEMTFEAEATIYGVSGLDIGTYTAFERVPGQIYGEGQGIFMTSTGEGAIWNGHGIGRMDENGTMIFAGSITYQAPQTGPLAKLNGVLGVFEHRAGMDGSAHSDLYEWKA